MKKPFAFIVVQDERVLFGSNMLAVAGAYRDANGDGTIYELLSEAQEKSARRTVQRKTKTKRIA